MSIAELKSALILLDVDVDNERAEGVLKPLDQFSRPLGVDVREFAELWEKMAKPPKPEPTPARKPRSPSNSSSNLQSPSNSPSKPPESAESRVRKAVGPKAVGPKARAVKEAEEKYQKHQAEDELKRARKQALVEIQKALAEAQPLSDALSERASSEQAWYECLDRVIEWDAIEENEFRRPQLKTSRTLVKSTVERALKRWGVTLDAINSVSLGATADELVSFFHTHVDSKYQETACQKPQSQKPSPRSRSAPLHPEPKVPVRAGVIGQMRTSTAKVFLENLGHPTHSLKRCPLYIVVTAFEAEGSAPTVDLRIFEKESDAFSTLLQMGGESVSARGVVQPLVEVKGVALEDLAVFCDDWQDPSRWMHKSDWVQVTKPVPLSPMLPAAPAVLPMPSSPSTVASYLSACSSARGSPSARSPGSRGAPRTNASVRLMGDRPPPSEEEMEAWERSMERSHLTTRRP